MSRCLVAVVVLGAALLQGCASAETQSSTTEGAKRNTVPRCQGAPKCRPTFIARLKNAPYPIEKNDDGRGRRFFRAKDEDTGARVRVANNGEHYPEPDHYADPSVLFHIPRHFQRDKPFRLVVYFHSHEAALDPGIVESGLLEQIDESEANVILIVPQLAYLAVDSHPGKLIRPGGLKRMLDEAADVLARTLGADMRARLAQAPIVLAAFSGGDMGLAVSLRERKNVGADRAFVSRIEGVILIDAIFDHMRFVDAWQKAHGDRVFLVAWYGRKSIRWSRRLIRRMKDREANIRRSLPSRIGRGTAAFLHVDTEHAAMMNEGPPRDPIAAVLSRLPSPSAPN